MTLLYQYPVRHTSPYSYQFRQFPESPKEHITEELLLDDLSKISNLSTSQFKQKFCHIVGVPPRTYINEKKVNYAKKLLLQGDSVTNKRSCPTVCWQDSFSYTLTF